MTLDLTEFSKQLDEIRMRTVVLDGAKDGPPGKAPRELEEMLEELRTTIEELQVAEEELRSQNQELEGALESVATEQRRYQDLFMYAPLAYMETDLQATIRRANFAAEDLVGAAANKLYGKPLAVFVEASDLPAFRKFVTELGSLRKTAQFAFEIISRTGQKSYVAATVSPLHDGEGRTATALWLFDGLESD